MSFAFIGNESVNFLFRECGVPWTVLYMCLLHKMVVQSGDTCSLLELHTPTGERTLQHDHAGHTEGRGATQAEHAGAHAAGSSADETAADRAPPCAVRLHGQQRRGTLQQLHGKSKGDTEAHVQNVFSHQGTKDGPSAQQVAQILAARATPDVPEVHQRGKADRGQPA